MNNNSWYKQMSVYQIWCRSFCDGNGDGIGDLWGVYSKLDYIKSLNVDAIWFSPIFPSPNADFGYDVSDYRNIHPDFGNLDIFKKVLDGAHERGLKVFMDLVVNHSSDEHEWFRQAKSSVDNPYHDYYIWKKGKTSITGRKIPPNNWTSMFEGGAWEYVEELDEYYLHLFAKKQPDLNMANPKVREEVKDILRFWLDMGVDGFREDVITFIGKNPDYPDAYPKLPVANGMQHYSCRPEALEYLTEFKNDVLDKYDCFVVAEGPLGEAKDLVHYIEEGPDKVFDEIISFNHMVADCFMTDFIRLPFDLKKMKKGFSSWQETLEGRAWPALYIENHDHPRIISRYGSEKYRVESGKMLAAMYMLQRGTPFVYQGQEIGMLNNPLDSVEKYPDVQVRNNANIAEKLHIPKKKILSMIQQSARDNARTPMQWDGSDNGGFSEARPWFGVNPNYTEINVASQEKDPGSLLNFYRELIKYRKESPVALWGNYTELCRDSDSLYVYERSYLGKKLLVVCSFTDEQVRFDAPKELDLDKGEIVFSNYDYNYNAVNGFTTRPYELRVYYFD